MFEFFTSHRRSSSESQVHGNSTTDDDPYGTVWFKLFGVPFWTRKLRNMDHVFFTFFCPETIHPFPNSHWLLVVVLRFCSYLCYLEKIVCTDRDSFFEKKMVSRSSLFSRFSHALLWSAWLVSSC